MSSVSGSYEDRVIALLGVHLRNDTKDFGRVVDYITVTMNASIRYVLVTDTGRRIDAGSAMRFLNAYKRKLAKAPAIVYPDGTDTVMRRRTIRVRRSGSHSITSGNIPTVADCGNDQRIDISSTVTSAGAFPEEYRENYGKESK